MKKRNSNLICLRNFFELVLREGNASIEEVENFVHELLVYMFENNDLNVEDFKISFHFLKEEDKFQKTHKQVKKSVLDQQKFSRRTLAIVFPNDNDDTKFDIYFPNSTHSFSVAKPIRHSKKKQIKLNTCDREEYFKHFRPLFSFIFDALHEFEHIVQYVLAPNVMAEFDSQQNNIDEDIIIVKQHMKSCEKKRLFLRTTERYFETLSYVALYEIDANDKAYEYYCMMLLDLMHNESDDELIDFLNYNLGFLGLMKKELKITKKIITPQHVKSCKKLNSIYQTMNDTFDELYSNF